MIMSLVWKVCRFLASHYRLWATVYNASNKVKGNESLENFFALSSWQHFIQLHFDANDCRICFPKWCDRMWLTEKNVVGRVVNGVERNYEGLLVLTPTDLLGGFYNACLSQANTHNLPRHNSCTRFGMWTSFATALLNIKGNMDQCELHIAVHWISS